MWFFWLPALENTSLPQSWATSSMEALSSPSSTLASRGRTPSASCLVSSRRSPLPLPHAPGEQSHDLITAVSRIIVYQTWILLCIFSEKVLIFFSCHPFGMAIVEVKCLLKIKGVILCKQKNARMSIEFLLFPSVGFILLYMLIWFDSLHIILYLDVFLIPFNMPIQTVS